MASCCLDGTFWGREILAMRVVPDGPYQLLSSGGAQYAHSIRDAETLLAGATIVTVCATVAGELIKIGVRCVIAAGWAVDDAATKLFAVTFYQAILRGCRFIDAVRRRRAKPRGPRRNTWAAYQDMRAGLDLTQGGLRSPATSTHPAEKFFRWLHLSRPGDPQ